MRATHAAPDERPPRPVRDRARAPPAGRGRRRATRSSSRSCSRTPSLDVELTWARTLDEAVDRLDVDLRPARPRSAGRRRDRRARAAARRRSPGGRRAHGPGRHRPRRSRAVAAGAQDYLVKGEVDGELLGRSVRYAIQRRRLEEHRPRALPQPRARRGGQPARARRSCRRRPWSTSGSRCRSATARAATACSAATSTTSSSGPTARCSRSSATSAGTGPTRRRSARRCGPRGGPSCSPRCRPVDILGLLERVLISERARPEVFTTVAMLVVHRGPRLGRPLPRRAPGAAAARRAVDAPADARPRPCARRPGARRLVARRGSSSPALVADPALHRRRRSRRPSAADRSASARPACCDVVDGALAAARATSSSGRCTTCRTLHGGDLVDDAAVVVARVACVSAAPTPATASARRCADGCGPLIIASGAALARRRRCGTVFVLVRLVDRQDAVTETYFDGDHPGRRRVHPAGRRRDRGARVRADRGPGHARAVRAVRRRRPVVPHARGARRPTAPTRSSSRRRRRPRTRAGAGTRSSPIPVMEEVRADGVGRPSPPRRSSEGRVLFDEARAAAEDYIDLLRDRRADAVGELAVWTSSPRATVALLVLAAVALGVALWVHAAPLDPRAARRARRGRARGRRRATCGTRSRSSGPGEIAALAGDVERMRVALVDQVAGPRGVARARSRCAHELARPSRPRSCGAPTATSSSSPTSPRTTCRSRCARSRASPSCCRSATAGSSTSGPTSTSSSRSTAPSACSGSSRTCWASRGSGRRRRRGRATSTSRRRSATALDEPRASPSRSRAPS